MAESVSVKAIIAGDIIEIYEYEKSYLKGAEGRNKFGCLGAPEGVSDEDKAENRRKVLQRAKNHVRRTINANVGRYGDDCKPKFLTLTFEEDIRDLKQAYREFKTFLQRFNYYVMTDDYLRYTAVPEFTKKGRVHFHVVLYNLPFVRADRIAELWGNGFIKINKIDQVDNVGAYVSKYMTEDADKIPQGSRCFYNSRGLKKYDEITKKEIAETLATSLPDEKLKYTKTFENDHLGVITYSQYNFTPKQVK